jgi:hypothetical protein
MTTGMGAMVKNKINWIVSVLLIMVGMLWMGVSAFGAESTTPLSNAPQSASADCMVLPVIEFPVPSREAERGYLGLSGSGNFNIGQIKAQAIIIEVFSFYCPHCQVMASQINDLYRLMQQRADLKEKIKLIGIGANNSAYEVDSFRERYKVPFPLFPDKELIITEKLCATGTPTFIGFKLNGQGSQKRFLFKEGEFKDNQKLLAEIIQAAGLK